MADGSPGWCAPGGAVDPDETYESAILRELREETGLVIEPVALAAPVWIRESLFTWKGTLERHLERFYVVRISERDADTAAIEGDSSGTPRDHHWWTLDEIRSSSEHFAPTRLAEHLASLLFGTIPQEPADVGEQRAPHGEASTPGYFKPQVGEAGRAVSAKGACRSSEEIHSAKPS